ncbi:hypothetical protein PFTANZ_03205 [Plasmodium falciparum Tanzania (2000708)]|uniref:Uncharacterized protein n=1 Tax=Plasmodium falciparum Tanzania (2000708) TaxID=1036725 RepID=A0A024W5X5_PLAFA|nr:hypothetical protein PFTANZ_03205 [Plasmodium falciparum Tanzania (2000708)]
MRNYNNDLQCVNVYVFYFLKHIIIYKSSNVQKMLSIFFKISQVEKKQGTFIIYDTLNTVILKFIIDILNI